MLELTVELVVSNIVQVHPNTHNCQNKRIGLNKLMCEDIQEDIYAINSIKKSEIGKDYEVMKIYLVRLSLNAVNFAHVFY